MMNPGLIGGWIGGILGIAGGIIGTFFSIRNTESPRERAFMIKACMIGWLAIAVFLILMFVLPTPYCFFLWIPYGILLPLGILFTNRTQQRIRKENTPR